MSGNLIEDERDRITLDVMTNGSGIFTVGLFVGNPLTASNEIDQVSTSTGYSRKPYTPTYDFVANPAKFTHSNLISWSCDSDWPSNVDNLGIFRDNVLIGKTTFIAKDENNQTIGTSIDCSVSGRSLQILANTLWVRIDPFV